MLSRKEFLIVAIAGLVILNVFIRVGWLAFISVLIFAVVAHEFGHLIVLNHYKTNPKVVGLFRTEFNATNLTKKQFYDIYMAGILTGLIPIIIFAVEFNANELFIYCALAIYLLGCRSDFKKLWGELRR